MPKRKLPLVISKADLAKKSTKELLGYLKRLRQCEESFERSDMDENLDLLDNQTIYFKQTEKWKLAYRSVKEILSNREHIER